MSDLAPQAPFLCTLCGRPVSPADYDDHLRRDHQLVSYRGIRRALSETLEAIRFDLFSRTPERQAWETLLRLAREEHGPAGSDWLAGWLATALNRLPPERSAAVLAALAEFLASEQGILQALANRTEPPARTLALEAFARCPVPIPEGLFKPLRQLMYDRSMPEWLQEKITIAHLQSPAGEEFGGRMLRWLTAKLSRTEALRRLERIRAAVGAHRLLDEAVSKQTNQARLECPRCGVELRRAAMEQHLWQEHRLLLEGLRVVSPWDVIEEWAKQYRLTHDPEYLQRCRVAAGRLGPEGGLERLSRLLLSLGVGDPGERAALLTRAAGEHASLCPWCYALVPVPRDVPALEVNLREGRLSAGGYEVEVSERGLFTWLHIATPEKLVYQGREPGQLLTPVGAATAMAGPIAVLALLLALIWPTAWLGPSLPFIAFLVLFATLVAFFAWLFGRYERPSSERLLHYAWDRLVPQLDSHGSAFVAGLAALTLQRRPDDAPTGLVATLIQTYSEAKVPSGHLALLCRLHVEKAASRGEDPVRLIERWIARCFEGQWPLSFAQHLLEDWSASWWSRGQLARLRARLCDRAFESGFEVQGLLDAGNNAPALGDVFRIEDERGLAGLRLMWSLRAARPWDRLGDARSVFELAAEPGFLELFEDHPGLLLWQRAPEVVLESTDGAAFSKPADVVLTVEGVWIVDEVFHAPPRVFEVRARSVGWELLLDGRTFRSTRNLEAFTRLLEKWFRLAFHEVLPGVERARQWVSPDRSALLRAWGAVPCPDCTRFLLPRVGAVGLALEETRA